MLKVAFFDSHRFDREAFEKENQAFGYSITYFEPRLTLQTADLVRGHDVVCSFVNDSLDRETLSAIKERGVRLVALRSAGYNHVDLEAAAQLDLPVVRVPSYSPHAIAEHAVCLLLALNRKIHKAYLRSHNLNFSLDGLVGFDLYGKTVGVVGTGSIGAIFAKILWGFGCRVLAYDVERNPALEKQNIVDYVSLSEIYQQSDVISLHVPLTPDTYHLINEESLGAMKKGVFLINTGRGALIDTKALIGALKSRHIGGAGLDVYEEEEGVFFQDLSEEILQDDVLARLLTFPNVLVTSHQGFLTKEALENIAKVSLQNISDFDSGKGLKNIVRRVETPSISREVRRQNEAAAGSAPPSGKLQAVNGKGAGCRKRKGKTVKMTCLYCGD